MDSELVHFLRGDPTRLDGRLVAIAKVATPLPEDHPGSGMVHRGLLSVQGNYRDQHTMAEFFRLEFGLSMESGIEEIIEQARQNGGIEGALDPEQVRERLRNMGDSQYLPIPAKVIRVSSLEAATKKHEGDVVYLGEFGDFQYAHMAVNSFPILYQARYREQERAALAAQIENMLGLLATPEPPEVAAEPNLETFEGNIEEHLLRTLLPALLYAKEGSTDADEALRRFQAFMSPHLYPGDVQRILDLVPQVRQGDHESLRILDLLVRKVAAIQREDWKTLETLRHELGELGAS
ncbi:MAG TPA: hypothetical protein PKO15_17405 [Fibrobacteria bacterium]|nr:hypothetical protein [Fibrobacteria bacterium]HOX52018.1 hypothetical protein [Fibrobacteria bacterium]